MASDFSYSEISMDNKRKKFSQKRRKIRLSKKNQVREFLNSMESEEETDGLADFKPPPQPELTRQPDPIKENEMATDSAVGPEAFTKLDTNLDKNFNDLQYKIFVYWTHNATFLISPIRHHVKTRYHVIIYSQSVDLHISNEEK